MVVRNEGHRLRDLLTFVRPWFEQIVIGVQDSDDDTLSIAVDMSPYVVRDRARGFGDATYPEVQRLVTQKWCFRLDGDERPTSELLESLSGAARYCEDRALDGLWIPFRSWIDDMEWEQPHSHLRFWANRIIWPPTLHSRPMTEKTDFWPTGYIEHRKSLDEHVQGYLGYLEAGRGNLGWTEHNKLMIRSAIAGAIGKRGREYVEGHEWWPEVLSKVYGGQRPTGPVPVAEP